MIDTVAGSSGFPVHTIFHVWRQILNDEGLSTSHLFSLEDKPPRCKEYVEDKVFAIDFDEKVVRVARTLNLIAGDGRTNVLHLRQSTEETVAVKSFAASFLSSGRLDAEYYQPKYDQAEEAIKDCGFPSQNLGSLIEPIQNGFDYREYTEEGTPYIRVGDVKNGQINFENAVKIPITMADVDKPVGLQVGDILFTRKGSFGNSAVVTELEINGIISSEIMLVRLTSISRQEILPEYVSLFLNSKFCYLQVERRVHGVAYYSISQPDLANLLIPLLPKPQQQKIAEKIKSSFSLKLNPNNC
ncbi:restriction endonuclease subunit S [Nostoc sp. T09]|uniref:restriction endonuclease subunit S n=1 Tax=Nostoc sp. T09 TaxID=1932621 RepID=UPI001C4EF20E|nr:restriction endonuclease subunit S [Nostoc sp. T09]